MSKTSILTFKYRVKDKHAAELNRIARAVNLVWNYANDAQKHSLKWRSKNVWLSGFDLTYMVKGASRELGILQDTICEVVKKYAVSRREQKLPYLRYRGRKNLGWVPFRSAQIGFLPTGIQYARKIYSVWMSRPFPPGSKIIDGGSFSQNAKGQWFINLVIRVPVKEAAADQSVGIDLGLKSLAVLSTGEVIEAPRLFRKSEERLGKAQRAGKKRQVRNIHAKIANQRKDFLHKVSTRLANAYGHIVVGNVSPSKLRRTRMGKSVSDAGWSDFRNMLSYKAIARCGTYTEVNEAYTSQACSECGSLSGPKGRKGLAVREWECVDCGSVHDRDHNSAILILRAAHGTLVAGAA